MATREGSVHQEALTAERALPARTASAGQIQTGRLRRCSPDMRFLIETGSNHSNIMFWRSVSMASYGIGGFVPEDAWSQWMPCARCGNHADALSHAVERLREWHPDLSKSGAA